ncbi:MAG TPA: acylphosphatase [Solirubrobacteraceae bacterium]|nr:acylphosphatase [Solirubrobacteraceae bacterium]
MSDRVARHVVVTGRVQGVFFRDCTRREARRIGVTGWVRNRRDGAVEAHFEGPDAAVAELVRWCREGPQHASVDDVHVEPAEPEGHERFDVR